MKTDTLSVKDYGIAGVLATLGIKQINSGATTGTEWFDTKGENIDSYSPADGLLIGSIKQATAEDYEKIIRKAEVAFKIWRMIPAPKRGEVVRQMGDQIRKFKDPLGKLVSYEMGKIYQEGLGEVQEMIDICDFAVGLSRQLHGFTMHSERPRHRMYEQYHPLGIIGVISAFNFPVAVWAWNAMLALVCGDVVVWKPSSKRLLPRRSPTIAPTFLPTLVEPVAEINGTRLSARKLSPIYFDPPATRLSTPSGTLFFFRTSAMIF